MKKKKSIDPQAYIGITSIVVTVAGMLWIGGFQHSTIMHEIQDIKEDIKEIKVRLDKIESDLHKMDVRVTRLEEHQKP